MIVLRPTGMHWLCENDERLDPCAHGGVFTVDSIRFVPKDDVVDEVTLTAAGLFLLRTCRLT
jgi:hypothetical protein